jgi:hypothetical protein
MTREEAIDKLADAGFKDRDDVEAFLDRLAEMFRGIIPEKANPELTNGEEA